MTSCRYFRARLGKFPHLKLLLTHLKEVHRTVGCFKNQSASLHQNLNNNNNNFVNWQAQKTLFIFHSSADGFVLHIWYFSYQLKVYSVFIVSNSLIIAHRANIKLSVFVRRQTIIMYHVFFLRCWYEFSRSLFFFVDTDNR